MFLHCLPIERGERRGERKGKEERREKRREKGREKGKCGRKGKLKEKGCDGLIEKKRETNRDRLMQ